MKNGPLIIIDDDEDDRNLFRQIFTDIQLKNEPIYFANTRDAMAFLKTTPLQPFLIICDINMPGENGLKFKEKIDQDEQLREKSIPFVFYSTDASRKDLVNAYRQLAVQGFFLKQAEYAEIVDDLQLMIKYWQRCLHPNS